MIERGFFNDERLFGEESKVVTDAMEVDESSHSSEEIKEQEIMNCKKGDSDDISAEVQRNLATGADCLIGDPELLESKKHLMVKMTPLSLVSQLTAKLP